MSDTIHDSGEIEVDEMLIQSYLDGEVEGSDLSELERRLSESPELRARVEAAEREHADLRAALRAPAAPRDFHARLGRALDGEARDERRSHRSALFSWALPGAAALAGAAALVLFITQSWTHGFGDDGDVAREAVRQRIRTATPVMYPAARGDVSESLARALPVPVEAPRFVGKDVSLEGWRPSLLRGHYAAQLHYSATTASGRHLVNVHMLDARKLDLGGQQEVDVLGRSLWVDHPLGYTTVSYKDDAGIGYIFSADMPDTELIELIINSNILHHIDGRFR